MCIIVFVFLIVILIYILIVFSVRCMLLYCFLFHFILLWIKRSFTVDTIFFSQRLFGIQKHRAMKPWHFLCVTCRASLLRSSHSPKAANGILYYMCHAIPCNGSSSSGKPSHKRLWIFISIRSSLVCSGYFQYAFSSIWRYFTSFFSLFLLVKAWNSFITAFYIFRIKNSSRKCWNWLLNLNWM